jgi:hypothetical protein
MKQHGLTILSDIDKAHIQDLDVVLREIGDNIGHQIDVPFGDLALLHYASWVVFPDGKPGPQLIFGAAELLPLNTLPWHQPMPLRRTLSKLGHGESRAPTSD